MSKRLITRRAAITSFGIPIVSIMAASAGSGELVARAARETVDMVSVRDPRFGAKGDGVSDDTKAIQAAIDVAPIVHIPPGTYIVSDTITLPANRWITGAGAKTILRKRDELVGRVLANAPGAHVGIIIERLNIDGARRSTAYMAGKDGLFLTRCSGAVVREVTVSDCLNDGIIIEYGKGNSVRNCVALRNAKDGIYSSGGRDIIIENNQTKGNLVAGIAIAATRSALIKRNHSWENASDIMLGRDSRLIKVIENNCRSTTAFVVSGENIEGQTLNGVFYPSKPSPRWNWKYGARFCTLERNFFGGEVRLILFDDGLVSANVCTGSPAQGLLIQGSNRNRVIGNKISDWGKGYYGVQLASLHATDGVPVSQGPPIRSEGNIVKNNNLSDSAGQMAIIDGGQNNRIYGNKINIFS